MTLNPASWIQPWSATLPGESSSAVPLPAHSDRAQRRESALEHNALRQGIAPRQQASAVAIAVPVAPAQPLLRLAILGVGGAGAQV